MSFFKILKHWCIAQLPRNTTLHFIFSPVRIHPHHSSHLQSEHYIEHIPAETSVSVVTVSLYSQQQFTSLGACVRKVGVIQLFRDVLWRNCHKQYPTETHSLLQERLRKCPSMSSDINNRMLKMSFRPKGPISLVTSFITQTKKWLQLNLGL